MLKDYIGHNNCYIKKYNWNDEEYDFERDWGWFTKNSKLTSNLKILELGCGTAPYLVDFTKISDNYTGVDIASIAIKRAIKQAQENSINAKFYCLDFVSNWHKKHKYNLVVDSFFLHCIIGEDRIKVAKQIYELLQVGGEVWINTMCNPPKILEHLKSYNKRTKCMEVIRSNKIISTRYFGNAKDIRNLFENIGLKCLEEKELKASDQDNYLGIFSKI